MILFGHLGIGSKLVTVWPKLRNTPLLPLFFGTILPDIIDKTIYYSISWSTGKHGSEMELIKGTRNFAHTGLFLVFLGSLVLLSRLKLFHRSKAPSSNAIAEKAMGAKTIAAISLGAATHLFLDTVIDLVRGSHEINVPLLWPLPGWEFPTSPFHGLQEHLFTSAFHPILLGSEVVGFILLLTYFFPKSGFRTRSGLPHIKPHS